MRIPNDSVLNITLALRDPDRALQAIAALEGDTSPASVDGLTETVLEHSSAAIGVAAIRALKKHETPSVADALIQAISSSRATVRSAAIESLAQRKCRSARLRFVDVLRSDQAWMVRRAAVQGLAQLSDDEFEFAILEASNDPHWRVRHALLNVILRVPDVSPLRQEIIDCLESSSDIRSAGLSTLLEHRWSVELLPEAVEISRVDPWLGVDPESVCPFWDWDPRVLAQTLKQMGREGRQESIDVMPALLFHGDERVRRPALRSIELDGDDSHIIAALKLRDDPRHDGNASLNDLLRRMSQDRLAGVACRILATLREALAESRDAELSNGQIAWALDQIPAFVPDVKSNELLTSLSASNLYGDRKVPAAMARLAGRADDVASDHLVKLLSDVDHSVRQNAAEACVHAGVRISDKQLCELLEDESTNVRLAAAKLALKHRNETAINLAAADRNSSVRLVIAEGMKSSVCSDNISLRHRLQSDSCAEIRATTMTASVAKELLASPENESSWHVLRAAARTMKVPYWNIEPEVAWKTESWEVDKPETLECSPAGFEYPRQLASPDWHVCPLGLSGHYGLPVDGYCKAVERGVDLLFWEPNYQTLTDFSRRISPTIRSRLGFVAGTFEADPDRIRKDVEQALSMLRLETLDLFLIFWVRSWRRIPDEVVAELNQLKSAGLIRHFGLSTHSRSLAVEAIQDSWNPVMVRHSAVHRKAEDEVFPTAAKHGTSILTFSNTCYGRLLEPTPAAGLAPDGERIFSAADCYRYTLAQPSVTACWTAPSTLAQLDENLAVLDNLEMDAASRQAIERRGAWLYNEETIFRRLVRER